MKTTNRMITVSLLFGLTAGYASGQGSLTPTSAPAPTMKTLQQVEPRIDVRTLSGDGNSEIIIAESGSYYLSDNLDVGKTYGIYINATNVTLDLNGFSVARVSGGGGYGIFINSGMNRATIRNGTVSGFNYGVFCLNSPNDPEGCLFEALTVSECGGFAIRGGLNSRVIKCCANNNQGTGIFASYGSIVSGCVAQNNRGSYGIGVNGGGVIIDCAAYENQATYGIYGHEGSAIKGCSSYNNEGTALSSYGIYIQSKGVVIQCSAVGNSNTNAPSTSEQGAGIYAFSGIIKDCMVANNQGDGIRINRSSLVKGNSCVDNGNDGDGAGIRIEFMDNRIEGNTVTGNDRGIDLNNSGNLVVCNSASGNTVNYDISGTQTIGPIITTTGTITNNNPWANFEY